MWPKRGTLIASAGAQAPELARKISAVASAVAPDASVAPPATRTSPLERRVAVCWARAVAIDATASQLGGNPAQATGLVPEHAPAWQMSVCVHALPSLQAVPLVAAGFEQAPVAESQVPATWHWSVAAHATGFDPRHAPLWHESVCVHALPSLQLVPLGAAGFEHNPLPGSHIPGAWHWSLATHRTGLVPVHVPDWQLSVCVHALPSLHAVPSATGGFEHAPVLGLHVPAAWH
jgi:hypothetical protein